MRRLHLVELEDEPWCPRPVRDAATDYLEFMIRLGNPYAPVVPLLREALRRTGARRIVDLCSGGGGPWPRLLPELDREGAPVEVLLTDLYPNLDALRRVRAATGGRLAFREESVDATRIPPGLDGFRTLFTSFHHFPPERARTILRDAVRARQGIGVFEATKRSPGSVAAMLPTPLAVLLATPFIRPFRPSRLLWTYLLPAVPALVLWDGVVSCLRTYTPDELREMTEEFAGEGFRWEIGEAKGKGGPAPLTYLLGWPEG
ncbi:MAG: class I SAM-dependent methyltransferase [Longimicrobiaceae bacterium]